MKIDEQGNPVPDPRRFFPRTLAASFGSFDDEDDDDDEDLDMPNEPENF